MPKGSVIGNTGAGKTLWVSLYARRWKKKNPNGIIYCNYHLNLPDVHFTPFMVLPFEEIRDCGVKVLIIYDDVSNLDEIKRFAKMLANMSRKLRIEMIMTAQYYTMIPPNIRAIADYKIRTIYNKKTDILKNYTKYRDLAGIVRLSKFKYYDAVKTVIAENLYDTNEIVEEALESDKIREIIKLSKNKRDVEKNLFFLFGNKADRRRLFKIICKKMNFELDDVVNDEKEEKQQYNWYLFYILNKMFKVSFKDLSLKYKIDKTKIFNKVKEIDYFIKEENLDLVA